MASLLTADALGRAATLAQRLARAISSPAGAALPEPPALAAWRRAAVGGDAAAFARRLGWDGIDPAAAAAALAAEPERSALGLDPEVERWLHGVVARSGRTPRSPHLSPAEIPFAELIEPWVAESVERLDQVAPGWDAPFAPAARSAWIAGLGRRLAWIAGLALHARFARAATLDAEPGRYLRFVATELALGWRGALEEFPCLAALLAGRAADWVEASAELGERLARDGARLALELAAGSRAPGRVLALDTGLSDPHARGRRVVALRFESGLEVVYKPRPVALEAWLERLLGALRRAGLEIAPPAVPTVDRGDYGWQLRVRAEEPADEREVEDWFRAAGALAAIGWLYGARDLHAENLVATRCGPALVDAEMLLAPRLAAERALPESFEGVLATGLLADPTAPAGPGALGYAGLDAPEPGALGVADRRWSGLGGDDLRLELARAAARPLANLPRLGGRIQRVEAHAPALLEGFERTTELVARLPADVRFPPVHERAETRILFRPSAQYGEVLGLLVEPRYLADGLASSLLLEALLRVFAASPERPLLWPLVAEERAALERLDVPVFRLPVTARALATRAGQPIEGWVARSGVEAARARLGALDARAIGRERAALERASRPRALPRALEEGRLLAAAGAIAEALERSEAFAAPPGQRATLRDLALYGGVAGRALFAAGAHRATGRARWLGIARRLAEGLGEALAADAGAGESGEAFASRPGGTDGWGSLVWSLVTLAELLEDRRLLEGARAASRRLERAPFEPDRWGFDLAAGEAGALLGLLALAEAGEAEALAAARRRGDRLIESALAGAGWPAPGGGPPLAGFAHGAAGIARALDALARATGEAGYARAAESGRDYERQLFDGRRGDWPALVAGAPGAPPERRWLASWCHGAPGVALDRALRLASGEDRAAEAELAAALATVSGAPLPEVDHLCCGTAGRITALAAAARWLGSESPLAEARRLAHRAMARAEGRGGWTVPAGGDGEGRPELGFFRGYPGLAWTLVALTPVGAGLPLVAALELPSERRRRENAA